VRKIAIATIVAAGLTLAASGASAQTQPETGYAPVNGIELYYEIHGTGDPLVLIHGGVGLIEMFGPLLPALAAGRQVIAVDLQAHGRTADIDRPLTFEAMADDIAALITWLGLEQADVMGYSLGGGVALQTAIRHPDLVRKLVLVSAPFSQDGWYPENVVAMGQMGPAAAEPMMATPMYQAYAAVAPRLADWPVLLTKLGELLRQDYDWTAEVAALTIPTLLVVGDADMVRTAHAVEFFALLGGGQRDAGWDGAGRPASQLAILPGVTHYDIFMRPELAAAVTPFLDAPLPATP
jgi:pimeloyl-ACP methyl ester carboxylesterase